MSQMNPNEFVHNTSVCILSSTTLHSRSVSMYEEHSVRDCISILVINFNLKVKEKHCYYIVRTDEGQPRPKYIFNKCGTTF